MVQGLTSVQAKCFYGWNCISFQPWKISDPLQLGRIESKRVFFHLAEAAKKNQTGSWRICCTAVHFLSAWKHLFYSEVAGLYADTLQQLKHRCRPQNSLPASTFSSPVVYFQFKEDVWGSSTTHMFLKISWFSAAALLQWKHNVPQQLVSRRRFVMVTFFSSQFCLCNYITLAMLGILVFFK